MAEGSAGPQQDGSQVAVEYTPDYQQYMRVVDCRDQYIGVYTVGRRSKKRLFSHSVTSECAILNIDSYARPVQHALQGQSKHDFLKFC